MKDQSHALEQELVFTAERKAALDRLYRKIGDEVDGVHEKIKAVNPLWVFLLKKVVVNPRFVEVIVEKEFAGIELTLWLPESNTEKLFLTQCALPESCYCLSGIQLPESFEEFKETVFSEYLHNCPEFDFGFFRTGVWSIGLLASRHYRTYVFPSYWRQFIQNKSDLKYD